jgi:hypothetical protein
MSEAVPVLSTAYYPLSDAQLAVADLIIEEFVAAGFGYPVAAAAVVNAYRERSLDPEKASSTGRYVGLFQLSPDILASEADRKDPRKNTRAIIEEATRSRSFMERAASSTHIPTLAGDFAYYVERPLDKAGERSTRYQIATRMYPEAFWENSEEALTPRAPKYRRPVGFIEDPENKPVVLLAVLAFVSASFAMLKIAENRRREWAAKSPVKEQKRQAP